MAECLFCKIAAKEIPSTAVYENDYVYAFRDLSPAAPTHVLVIPKAHMDSLADASQENAATLGEVMSACAEVARLEGIEKDGYRTVINTNAGAGQSVFHLHAHVIGGRELSWPPG